MNLTFSKMQGTGNDFIMVDRVSENYNFNNLNKLAQNLCDRHFGIGGDGLIFILPPENKDNDFQMRIFNADGSEAEMCGNGIRCFAHFVKTNNLSNKNELKVETLAGIIRPQIIKNQDSKSKVRVNMGQPLFKPEAVPVKINSYNNNFVNDFSLEIDGKSFNINCVSMGNPHTVIFDENISEINIEKWGPKIETHNIFPEKTNVEFIKINNTKEIVMKVWERGAGITLACGTGACAAAAAGIKKGYLSSEVTVHVPGGDLLIEWNEDEDIKMTGPATTVFTGETLSLEKLF